MGEKIKMTQDELLEIIDRGAKFEGSVLDLSGLGITELPPEIKKLRALRKLILDDNHLTDLPPEIGELKNLESLWIRNNSLRTLPQEINCIPNLYEILLNENRFGSIPDSIVSLKRLTRLNLQGNNIRGLPDGLYKMSDLRFLALGRNSIRHISTDIKHLKNLRYLSFEQNLITTLPIQLQDIQELVGIDTFVHVIFYGNPLLPIPPETFGMVADNDFMDFAWITYLKAIDCIDDKKFTQSVNHAVLFYEETIKVVNENIFTKQSDESRADRNYIPKDPTVTDIAG